MPILPNSNVLNVFQCWQRLEQAAIPAVKSTMDVLPCRNVKFKMLLTSFSPKSTDWLGISIFIPTAKFWCFHGDIQRDATRTSKNWYITRLKCLYMRTNWLRTICNIKTSSKRENVQAIILLQTVFKRWNFARNVTKRRKENMKSVVCYVADRRQTIKTLRTIFQGIHRS